MRLKKYLVYINCIFLLSISSCKDGFKEINKNPNMMEKVLPENLLPSAISETVKGNMSRCRSINNELMQVHITMGDSDFKVFRYDVRGTLSTSPWDGWYTQLQNLSDVYKSAEERFSIDGDKSNKTFMGISLICQAWVFSLITDMYGDIPYNQALKGKEGIIYPVFDKQKDIYLDIFQKLEQANTLLALNENLPDIKKISDPLYQGNALKWRKFCNALYLRLLLRVSGKSEMDAGAKMLEIVQTKASTYPIFTSNDDSAILKWTGIAPFQSPFYNTANNSWTVQKYTEFFIDNLRNWGDPRLPLWASTYNGQFLGVPGGYAVGTSPVAKSRPLVGLKNDPLIGNVLNYSELQFILAEAVVKGWITKQTAKTYYESGITAGITLWGATVPTNHFNLEPVKWDDALTVEDKLEKIHQQKYYALFYTDFQQWYEYRRTGHPILPQGPGLENGGVMPSRLNYPIYLYATNQDNLLAAIASQGEDDINTKIWWNKP